MILEIGLLAESSLTNVALERPGSRVDVHVRFEVAGGGERFGTHCALVRFLLWRKENELEMD